MTAKKSNMYQHSKKQWNPFVGCLFDCPYCKLSFQAQLKRWAANNCQDCYNYKPHFHENRLDDKMPVTRGLEFISCCLSGDISFAHAEWIEAIIEKIKEWHNRTFLIQTKNPIVLENYDFPENVLLGITMETNRDYWLSNAPLPRERASTFARLDFPSNRKIVTIEPIIMFDWSPFNAMIKKIHPGRVYVGYDTKNTGLEEPRMELTRSFIKTLNLFTDVYEKYIPRETQ